MTCPVCGGDTKVAYCVRDCEGVYRRRKCIECEYKFYTTELESDGDRYNELYRIVTHNKRHNKNITKTG